MLSGNFPLTPLFSPLPNLYPFNPLSTGVEISLRHFVFFHSYIFYADRGIPSHALVRFHFHPVISNPSRSDFIVGHFFPSLFVYESLSKPHLPFYLFAHLFFFFLLSRIYLGPESRLSLSPKPLFRRQPFLSSLFRYPLCFAPHILVILPTYPRSTRLDPFQRALLFRRATLALPSPYT